MHSNAIQWFCVADFHSCPNPCITYPPPSLPLSLFLLHNLIENIWFYLKSYILVLDDCPAIDIERTNKQTHNHMEIMGAYTKLQMNVWNRAPRVPISLPMDQLNLHSYWLGAGEVCKCGMLFHSRVRIYSVLFLLFLSDPKSRTNCVTYKEEKTAFFIQLNRIYMDFAFSRVADPYNFDDRKTSAVTNVGM